jgi:hypothetical protein
MQRLRRLIAASLIFAVSAAAQDPARPTSRAPARVPFGVGERLEYDVRFGLRLLPEMHVGNASMEVSPFDTVRGRETWHTVFSVHGGFRMYRVNDRYESWFDTRTLASLRYVQDINEGNYDRERRFEIYPERREFVLDSQPPEPTVAHPLDEGSFLYFLRTIGLAVGKDTSFNDYFRPDRNPVRIRVVKKDRIHVPAGWFNAIVVEPVIVNTKIFSEGGGARVWLSDDDNRIMLQMKSKLWFGSLNLYLKSYRPPPANQAKTVQPSTTHP